MAKSAEAKEESKICFVISPIGEDGSPERKRADDVLDFVIEPAAKEGGLTVLRADKIDQSGSITSQIVDMPISAKIVVADFWGHNPNVFYELAIRHAWKLPVIHLYFDRIPFDVNQMRAIKLNHEDLRSAEEARKAVLAQMKGALEDDFEQWTPIGVAIDLGRFQSSASGTEQRLGEMYAMIETLISRSKAPTLPTPPAMSALAESLLESTPVYSFFGDLERERLKSNAERLKDLLAKALRREQEEINRLRNEEPEHGDDAS